MIIRPGIGIDNVKFGMTELEVIALLGEPDLIKVDEDDEDQNQVYQYNKIKIQLSFYTTEENRLSYVRTCNPNASIDGIPVMDKTLESISDSLGTTINDWEVELYFSFNAYFNLDRWITLHEEYGVIANIEMGVNFMVDSDELDWPK